MRNLLIIIGIISLIVFSGCSGSYNFEENSNIAKGEVQVNDEKYSGEVRKEEASNNKVPMPPALPED